MTVIPEFAERIKLLQEVNLEELKSESLDICWAEALKSLSKVYGSKVVLSQDGRCYLLVKETQNLLYLKPLDKRTKRYRPVLRSYFNSSFIRL